MSKIQSIFMSAETSIMFSKITRLDAESNNIEIAASNRNYNALFVVNTTTHGGQLQIKLNNCFIQSSSFGKGIPVKKPNQIAVISAADEAELERNKQFIPYETNVVFTSDFTKWFQSVCTAHLCGLTRRSDLRSHKHYRNQCRSIRSRSRGD